MWYSVIWPTLIRGLGGRWEIGMVSQEWISIVVDRLVREFQPERLILFGSQARGAADSGSDLDLLVVLPTVSDKRRSAIAMRRALSQLPIAKDIVVTSPEEISRRGHLVGTVLYEALREGKVLYERPGRAG
jgi:predicted nucleotidyltransferase